MKYPFINSAMLSLIIKFLLRRTLLQSRDASCPAKNTIICRSEIRYILCICYLILQLYQECSAVQARSLLLPRVPIEKLHAIYKHVITSTKIKFNLLQLMLIYKSFAIRKIPLSARLTLFLKTVASTSMPKSQFFHNNFQLHRSSINADVSV